ncbi:hypothetical protein IAQ61_001383 [Plenodomus lingam]|uniref:uncharacterized protein n=1 Tax=Leptosphaeria maculans TaxID=5022 RepID=UPI00331945DA|nr:hypothetical protein IAQ61_001383 [Plenodomus lingam]
MTPPKTMQAWQYNSTTPSLSANLHLNPSHPTPTIPPTSVLIKTHFAALNPVDYKVPEGPLPLRLLGTNLIPCADFSGTVVAIGASVTDLAPGDAVFGAKVGSFAAGSLAQYVAVPRHMLAKVPAGVNMQSVAGMGIAGLTEYQAIVPNVDAGAGDKVFINGGSGGTGAVGVQIAKALGCHVTATCSTGNMEFVRGLGADEVLDYTSVDVVNALCAKGAVFKLVVDNVGTPPGLYKASDKFLIPGEKFVQVGADLSLGGMRQITSSMVLPRVLGGGRNSFQMLFASPNQQHMEVLAGWMAEGKVKGVTDTLFEWEDVPKAFERLKTGRAKGKVVVRIKQEEEDV